MTQSITTEDTSRKRIVMASMQEMMREYSQMLTDWKLDMMVAQIGATTDNERESARIAFMVENRDRYKAMTYLGTQIDIVTVQLEERMTQAHEMQAEQLARRNDLINTMNRLGEEKLEHEEERVLAKE